MTLHIFKLAKQRRQPDMNSLSKYRPGDVDFKKCVGKSISLFSLAYKFTTHEIKFWQQIHHFQHQWNALYQWNKSNLQPF